MAESNSGQLVTIGRFLEPVNAQMAKGPLDSAGIESFLQGENANNMMAFAFRVRLQVQPQDEAAARELLASSGENGGADSIGDEWDTSDDGA